MDLRGGRLNQKWVFPSPKKGMTDIARESRSLFLERYGLYTLKIPSAVSSLIGLVQLPPIFECRMRMISPSGKGLSSLVFGISMKHAPEMFRAVFLDLVPTNFNEVWIGLFSGNVDAASKDPTPMTCSSGKFTSGSASSSCDPIPIGNALATKTAWRVGVQTDYGVDVPNTVVALSSGSMGFVCAIQAGSEDGGHALPHKVISVQVGFVPVDGAFFLVNLGVLLAHPAPVMSSAPGMYIREYNSTLPSTAI